MTGIVEVILEKVLSVDSMSLRLRPDKLRSHFSENNGSRLLRLEVEDDTAS